MTTYRNFTNKDYMQRHFLQAECENINFQDIPAFLRTLLVTDGTVSKCLEAYFWERINVESVKQAEEVLQHEEPWLNAQQNENIIRRNVKLAGSNSNRTYLYASSIIRTGQLNKHFVNEILLGKIGIGELLQDSKFETCRKIMSVRYGDAAYLEKEFGEIVSDDIISRTYLINSDKKACIMVTEHFPLALYRE